MVSVLKVTPGQVATIGNTMSDSFDEEDTFVEVTFFVQLLY